MLQKTVMGPCSKSHQDDFAKHGVGLQGFSIRCSRSITKTSWESNLGASALEEQQRKETVDQA